MIGCYIHIPFCAKKCTYCDFHFSTTFEAYRAEMIQAIQDEIKLRASAWNKEKLQTIYFGGGTPSLLTQEELTRILKTLKKQFSLDKSIEITLECNPDDCSSENLASWKKAGVNRLSIGLQSFTDSQLEWMNRTHSADEGKAAVLRAQEAGFTNITVDLMYGLPDLSNAAWVQQLDAVIELDVQHISAYCLTVEQDTVLASWVKQGKLHPANADQSSEQFELLVETLAKAGFEQYEISNFAKNNALSKHNSNYWKGVNYLGIGPSAHGFDGTSRYWNVANNQQYINALQANTLPETRELLSNFDQFNEALLIGLRTIWGVEKERLFSFILPDQKWHTCIEGYKNQGLLLETESHFFLTQAGRLLADAIASDLFVLAE